VSLSAHLTAGTAEHGRLSFHPDCPRCRAERLGGSLAADSLVSRRTRAALAAGLLAFTGAVPAAGAQVPGIDEQQDAAPAPGGEPPGLQPDFDPGGGDTFDHETAPLPGGREAGGAEDEGLGAPVEIEETTDTQAPLVEGAPAPAAPAPEQPPPPAPQPPSPAPPVEPPAPPPAAVAPPATPPTPSPPAELGKPAPQPGPRETSTQRKPPKRTPKTHEVDRQPVIGTNPPPPPQSPEPAVQATAAPAPTTVAVSAPSDPGDTGITGPSYTVRSGDSLWSIARRLLGADASAGQIAREVNRLWQLNEDRIATGNPSLIHVGTVLKL
jgi:outer membrane biosynthesis protein TonB